MNRPDIGDRLLAYLVFAAAVILTTHFALLPRYPEAWRLPGSPLLYGAAVAGTGFLMVSVGFLLTKRTGRGGSPVGWFTAHVVAATAGGVLVAIHSAGRLRYAPALLLLALLGLVGMGVWARVRLARQVAATFASEPGSFAPVGPGARDRLRAIVGEKERLLARLDPAAREGTFSLTLAHWLGRPGLARAYARLVREERTLLGTRRRVPAAQAYWRWAHIALAAVFLAGVVGHVIVVTFFAGYVAGGGEIYWWHLAAW